MPSRPRASTSSRCSAPSAARASTLDRPLPAAKSRIRRSRRVATGGVPPRRPCDQARPRCRADQRERRETIADRSRSGSLTDNQIDLVVLHRGVEVLLGRRRQAVDLVDEEHLAGCELAEHGDKIGGALNHRACGGMEVDAHLAGDDLRERRFSEPGGTKEKDVVERFTAALRSLDKDAQVVAQLMLTDEFIEDGGSHRAFGSVLFGLLRGDNTWSDVVHRASSSRPALISTSAPASLPSRRAAAAIAPSASVRPTPRFSSAEIASALTPRPFGGSLRGAAGGDPAGAATLLILSRNSLTMRAASRGPTPSACASAGLS